MSIADPRKPQRLSQARGDAAQANKEYWDAKTRAYNAYNAKNKAYNTKNKAARTPAPAQRAAVDIFGEPFVVMTLNFMAARDAANRAAEVTQAWKDWMVAHALTGIRVSEGAKILVPRTRTTKRYPQLLSPNVKRVAGEELWEQCKTVQSRHLAAWPSTVPSSDQAGKSALLDEFGIRTLDKSPAWTHIDWPPAPVPDDPEISGDARRGQLYAVLPHSTAVTKWRQCEQVRVQAAIDHDLKRQQWIDACEKALRETDWDGLREEFDLFTIHARVRWFNQERARTLLSPDQIARAQSMGGGTTETRWVWHDPGTHNHRGDDGELDEQDGQ